MRLQYFARKYCMAPGLQHKFTVSAQACILGAVMVLIVPAPWLVAWLGSVILHEGFHCLALMLCHVKICQIKIGVQGTQILTGTLTGGTAVICALAGPAGGLLLVPLVNTFPRLALCALVHSVYNLLPVYPLDGGRALYGCLQLLFPEKSAAFICNIVAGVVLVVIAVVCVAVTFIWKLGIFPIFFAAVFSVSVLKRKMPCKYAGHGVQ